MVLTGSCYAKIAVSCSAKRSYKYNYFFVCDSYVFLYQQNQIC